MSRRSTELLRAAHAHPGVTRAAAARLLGVGTGAATEIVTRLSRAGLLAEIPAAPSGAAAQRLSPGATVADLGATGTAVQFFATASGGTALPPATALVDGTTYYAGQVVGGCPSFNRLAIAVTLGAALPVQPSAVPGPDGLTLVPNPGRTPTLAGARAGAEVQVFDALGRLVFSATADARGAVPLLLPAALVPGIYVVRSGQKAVRLAMD